MTTAVARAGWMIVGALGIFSVLAMLTIGPLLLPLALGLAALLLWWRGSDRAAVGGLLMGGAGPLLWLAWLNRHGPGTFCRTTPEGVGCMDEWSPWPFVVIALLLIGAGVAVAVGPAGWRRGGMGE